MGCRVIAIRADLIIPNFTKTIPLLGTHKSTRLALRIFLKRILLLHFSRYLLKVQGYRYPRARTQRSQANHACSKPFEWDFKLR